MLSLVPSDHKILYGARGTRDEFFWQVKRLKNSGVKGFDLGYLGKSSMPRWQGGLAKHLAKYKRNTNNGKPSTSGAASNG